MALSNLKNPKASAAPWAGFAWTLLMVPATFLQGQSPSRGDKTYNSTANPHITVSNLKGQVVVKGWEKSQVHVQWTNQSPQAVEVDPEPMPDHGAAEKIRFTTHLLDARASGALQVDDTVDYDLEVPLGACLEVRNPEGRVRIERLQGDAWVDSVAGTISACDVSGHLAAKSVGGDIEIVRPTGRVEASSITGNLRFVAATGPSLRATTTSGKVFYNGDFVPGSDYHLSSYNGDMEIFCPAASSFELSATTVRGKLDNALSLRPKVHRASRLPAAQGLFGTFNTGSATVSLSSFSGIIKLRPQP